MTNVNFTCSPEALALSFNFCGQLVYISSFPASPHGFSDSPGCYFVESVIFTHDGQLKIGVEYEADKVEFYDYDDIEITHVVTGSEFVD